MIQIMNDSSDQQSCYLKWLHMILTEQDGEYECAKCPFLLDAQGRS